MSTEYYIACDECKKKVHVGCYSSLSGLQFWSGDKERMANVKKLLDVCSCHMDKLKFILEQSIEDEEYIEVGENDEETILRSRD